MTFKSITIKPTSCRCGGSYAWLGERPSGAWEMIGCVCHTPVRPEWLSDYPSVTDEPQVPDCALCATYQHDISYHDESALEAYHKGTS